MATLSLGQRQLHEPCHHAYFDGMEGLAGGLMVTNMITCLQSDSGRERFSAEVCLGSTELSPEDWRVYKDRGKVREGILERSWCGSQRKGVGVGRRQAQPEKLARVEVNGEERWDRFHLGLHDPKLPKPSPVSAVWKVWAWHKPCRSGGLSMPMYGTRGWILRVMWPREVWILNPGAQQKLGRKEPGKMTTSRPYSWLYTVRQIWTSNLALPCNSG